jgi:hypothetical protein
MAFPNSRIFREWLSAALEPRPGFNGAWALDNEFNCALYGEFSGLPEPDETVPADETAYPNGVWAEDEKFSPPIASNPIPGQSYWPAGGRLMTGTGSNPMGGDPPNTGTGAPGFSSTGILITFDADDTGTGLALVTLNAVFGDLVYDTTDPDTVTAETPENAGACFHAYGGTNSVTSGTFTVVWAAEGVMRAGVGIPP